MSLASLLAQLPPPRRAPRVRRNPDAEILVLGAILQGHPIRVAAIAAGVSEGGVRGWIRRDPTFRAKYQAAVLEGSAAYANNRRALLLAERSG